MPLLATSAQLTWLCFLSGLTLMPVRLCQEIEIDQEYCKTVCSALINTCKDQFIKIQGETYEDCIAAHPNCVCGDKKGTIEKMFAWAGIGKVASVAIISTTCVFLAYVTVWMVYKKCQQHYRTRSFQSDSSYLSVIGAATVTGNTRSSVNVSDSHRSHKVNASAPVDPTLAYGYQSANNVPLEYQPPPPYNECVRNYNNAH